MTVLPSIAAVISAMGKSPSCRCIIRVRSAGGGWSTGAAGPSPRPWTPWHALQYRTNTYGAETAEGCCAAARGIHGRLHHIRTIHGTVPIRGREGVKRCTASSFSHGAGGMQQPRPVRILVSPLRVPCSHPTGKAQCMPGRAPPVVRCGF
jgi:hypothetical protein